MSTTYTSAGAIVSPCERYRYLLWREWSLLPQIYLSRGAATCLFVMLNPSTADGSKDDPTIRKCVGFCKRWGYTRLEVVNLFAYRSTDPEALILNHALSPDGGVTIVGARNKEIVEAAMTRAQLLVCAWGNYGTYLNQDLVMWRWIRERIPACLGRNGNGTPKHPLTLTYTTPLESYSGRSP